MTLMGTSGGECVGTVIPTFLPTNDVGTVTVTQDGKDLLATLTMESTGSRLQIQWGPTPEQT
jgi:hypothetical protein